MDGVLLVSIVLSGLYVGGNIGANDAANCIGPGMGAGLIRYRTGIAVVALFVVAGALIQGGASAHTVGKGVVTDPIPPLGVLAALFSGGLFVTLATFFKIPVSTSQSVVGAVAGIGVVQGLTVNWSKGLDIVGSWILCPILSLALTWALYGLTLRVLRWTHDHRYTRQTLQYLVLASAAYAAYSLGANNLGNAIGPVLALGDGLIDTRLLIGLGGLSIGAGALLFGRGVAETVGRSILPLDLPGAFAVQVSTGVGLHVFALVGVPVSSSQAVVGAILGIGLYHGVRAVSSRKLGEIALGWVLTPLGSALFAAALFKGLEAALSA
ncbi:MAG: anion permease [Deltaproteobacteria bacterium]|nr:anion permease [Deltaproteobacteria bacterium]